MRISDGSPRKDVALEALRGVAALSVVVWHSLLAFYPEWTGAPGRTPISSGLAGQPWFGLVYGQAAVTLFFALSGFVLTRGYFDSFDDSTLLRGAIKRWPRLVGPVLLATLASYALFAFGLYRHEAAADLTGSRWLFEFGGASRPFAPGFGDALWQGLVGVFLTGDARYDSSLWTMRYEFVGSFLSFGLAAAVGAFRSRFLPLAVAGAALAIGCTAFAEPYLPFLAGVGLAFAVSRRANARGWTLAASLAAMALAIYAFGYSGQSVGAYGFAPNGLGGWVSSVHTAASALMIAAVEYGDPRLRKALSGRTPAFLGALSFPIYLVHVPVICSSGSALLIALRGAGFEPSRVLAFLSVAPVALIAALPLIAFDRWWVAVVGAWVKRLRYGGAPVAGHAEPGLSANVQGLAAPRRAP